MQLDNITIEYSPAITLNIIIKRCVLCAFRVMRESERA